MSNMPASDGGIRELTNAGADRSDEAERVALIARVTHAFQQLEGDAALELCAVGLPSSKETRLGVMLLWTANGAVCPMSATGDGLPADVLRRILDRVDIILANAHPERSV